MSPWHFKKKKKRKKKRKEKRKWPENLLSCFNIQTLTYSVAPASDLGPTCEVINEFETNLKFVQAVTDRRDMLYNVGIISLCVYQYFWKYTSKQIIDWKKWITKREIYGSYLSHKGIGRCIFAIGIIGLSAIWQVLDVTT